MFVYAVLGIGLVAVLLIIIFQDGDMRALRVFYRRFRRGRVVLEKEHLAEERP